MAINLKEIENRKYNETTREPMSFEYIVKNLEGPYGETQELRVWFERVQPEMYGLDETKPAYKIFTIINSVVYEKIYSMPKSNMSLELVVATGLNVLRFAFQEIARQYEMLSYMIADIVKDM